MKIDCEITLGELCKKAALAWPNETALVFDETGIELTFNDIEIQSNQLAHTLIEFGIQPGDRVAVISGNRPIFPVGWLATVKAGAAMVPVNPSYKDSDALHLLKHAEVSIVIVDEAQLELVRRIRGMVPSVRHVIVTQANDGASEVIAPNEHLWPQVTQGKPTHSVERKVNADMLANVQFTSGTTGMPKGCMLSHRYWTQLGQLIAQEFVGLTPRDILLTAQPFSYIDPQWNLVAVLASGAKLVVLARFRPSQFWGKVVAYGTTFFYCLGAMPMMLLAQEENEGDHKHQLRVVMCSGIPKDMHSILEQRFGVQWREVYGTTETGADIMVPDEKAEALRGSGSIGNALVHREVRIADENCAPVERGSQGELLIRGTGMMDGYFRNVAATQDAFAGGWYHTGDLAVMNALGQISIVGRKKDMIRRSGENIAASEVESVLEKHPSVLMAAVVAVPDALRGEEAKAFVIPRTNDAGKSLDFEDLASFVETHLARFKVPRYWEQRQEFPRTPSERVAKHLLQQDNSLSSCFDRLSTLAGNEGNQKSS